MIDENTRPGKATWFHEETSKALVASPRAEVVCEPPTTAKGTGFLKEKNSPALVKRVGAPLAAVIYIKTIY